MEKHLTLVAVLNIGFGLLGLAVSAVVFFVLVAAGYLSGEPEAVAVTSLVGTVIAFFLGLKAVPKIVAGFGLLKRKAWSRVLIMIIACLDLLEIPFGTVVGVYSLWVMLNEETVKLLNGKP